MTQANSGATREVRARGRLLHVDCRPRDTGEFVGQRGSHPQDGARPELASKRPRYPQLPVTLLGRLAVDQGPGGKGHGELLLIDALRRSLEAASEMGAMAVVVDAKDAAAEAFYEHFDCTRLQQQPCRLFLPMKTVAALFRGP